MRYNKEIKRYLITYDFNGRKYWQTVYARNKTKARRKTLKYPKVTSIERLYD